MLRVPPTASGHKGGIFAGWDDRPALRQVVQKINADYNALYPHMTVYQNMAFSLKLRHAPKDESGLKVRQTAEILDITQYLDRKPKALSGGQRQRVAIGRAIVRDPKVMLMDEPLSNPDAKLRNERRAEIIKLRERINTMFIYVTHDQTEAMNTEVSDTGVQAKVDMAEMMGSSVHLHVSAAGRVVIIIVPTTDM